jgi:hypothetical protein
MVGLLGPHQKMPRNILLGEPARYAVTTPYRIFENSWDLLAGDSGSSQTSRAIPAAHKSRLTNFNARQNKIHVLLTLLTHSLIKRLQIPFGALSYLILYLIELGLRLDMSAYFKPLYKKKTQDFTPAFLRVKFPS